MIKWPSFLITVPGFVTNPQIHIKGLAGLMSATSGTLHCRSTLFAGCPESGGGLG